MTIDTLLSPLEVILLKKERQQGIEEGRQEGRQEGLQEGRQEGCQEGLLQARRADILETLESRFGPLPGSISEKIRASRDEGTLRKGLRAAFTAASLEDFLRSSGLES